MNLILATLSVLLCSVTSHPHPDSSFTHTHHRIPNRRQEKSTLCLLLDYLLCGRDLCRSSYCYYYPEARCRVIPLHCGCRAAWFTQRREVDCDVPHQFQRRTGLGGSTSTAHVNSVPSLAGRNLPVNQQASFNPNPLPMSPRTVSVDPGPVSMGSTVAQQEVCPQNVLLVECRYDPCFDAPNIPGTECRPNYCGGCIADMYRNGMKVPCTDCEFPHLIVPSSVMKKDHSAYKNTYTQDPIPTAPTNQGFWTEAGPPIPITELVVQDASPTRYTKPANNLNSGSSVLDLQRNIASVSHLSSTGSTNNEGISSDSSVLDLQSNIASVGHISNQPTDVGTPDPVLNLQSNIGSVGHISNQPTNVGTSDPVSALSGSHLSSNQQYTSGDGQSPAAINSQVSSRMTGVRVQHLVSMKPAHVVEPNAVCPEGKQQAKCYSDPCYGRTCEMYPSAVCRPSPCGNCEAKWYLNGSVVDCERCNGTTYVTSCPMNPCDFYSCPAFPHAECRMSKCGSCRDVWYDDGKKVSCEIPWPACTEKENQQCRERCSRTHCPQDYETLCRVKGCGSQCKLEYYKVKDGFFVPVSCNLRGKF